MSRTLMKCLHRFHRDARGTVAVEAVIMFPLLLWVWVATYVFFDAYRQSSALQKAAYTIGDIISRETDVINEDYIDAIYELFEFLAKSESDNALRISVLRMDGRVGDYRIDWSTKRGSIHEMHPYLPIFWGNRLPEARDDERIIVVEARSAYDAPFRVGLDSIRMESFVFTRPRFAPQIVWQD